MSFFKTYLNEDADDSFRKQKGAAGGFVSDDEEAFDSDAYIGYEGGVDDPKKFIRDMLKVNIAQFTCNGIFVGVALGCQKQLKDTLQAPALFWTMVALFVLTTLVIVCNRTKWNKKGSSMTVPIVLTVVNTIALSFMGASFAVQFDGMVVLQAAIMLFVMMVVLYWLAPHLLNKVPEKEKIRNMYSGILAMGILVVSGLTFLMISQGKEGNVLITTLCMVIVSFYVVLDLYCLMAGKYVKMT